MKIELYIGGSYLDITECVEFSSIIIQSRSDFAFSSGSLKAWFDTSKASYNLLNTNIQPYTPIKIDNEVYVCKSRSNSFMNEPELYVHEIDLMELTAILSGMIVGTKGFSTTGWYSYDYKKIEVLFHLMEIKYGFSFSYGDALNKITTRIGYQFKAGSTLYDCLVEICEQNNAKVVVTNVDISNKIIVIDIVNLNSQSIIAISNQVISEVYSQNDNQYCKYLETEANNVVDRTTTTHIKGLTCRADDILVNENTAKLFLPTNVENIINFGLEKEPIKIEWSYNGNIRDNSGTVLNSNISGQSYQMIYRIADYINNGRNDFLNTIYNDHLKPYLTYEQFLNCGIIATRGKIECTKYTNRTDYEGPTGATTSELIGQIDISLNDRILPKKQWELLDPKTQAGICYYEVGNNQILNLYNTYKSDIWNAMLGNTGKPLLQDISVQMPSGGIITSLELVNKSNKPTLHTYYVDYVAITNPYLIDTKDYYITSNYIFELSQTYGNGASLIDYDKIVDYMTFTNRTMGRKELQLEIDSTNSDLIKAPTRIGYKGTAWYVSNVTTTYNIENRISVLNCVIDYNKKADCIGVDSQFNETKNPLNMIVTRPLRFEITGTEFDENKCYYLRLKFTSVEGYINSAIFKNLSVQRKNNNIILTCEADDQYSFGSTIRDKGFWNLLADDVFKQEPVKYVDSRNEALKVDIKVVELKNLSFATSKTLPYYDGEYVVLYDLGEHFIYKDAREKLTFTINLKLTL